MSILNKHKNSSFGARRFELNVFRHQFLNTHNIKDKEKIDTQNKAVQARKINKTSKQNICRTMNFSINVV